MSTPAPPTEALRYDLRVVASWIAPGSKVLGLGCGEGELLHHLKSTKRVACTGIEINEQRVAKCIARGLTVMQGDVNIEVEDYPDDAFDYVVLAQTLQQIYQPAQLIKAMMRIGRKGIVSFPNFSHWSIRMQLLFTGYAPKNKQLPYDWHNTPNIRVITLKDFRRFARETGFTILKEVAINTHNRDLSGRIIDWLPNLRATYGIFLIGKDTT